MPALSVYPENRVPRGVATGLAAFPGFLALPSHISPWVAKVPGNGRGFGLSSGTLWFLSGVRHACSSGGRLRGASSPRCRPQSVSFGAVCLIMGISRGLMWDRRILTVKEVARPGVSVHLTVIPLEEPRPEANGPGTTFRAIAVAGATEPAGSAWRLRPTLPMS